VIMFCLSTRQSSVYVPHLQTVGAMVGYLRVHRDQRFASTTAVAPIKSCTIARAVRCNTPRNRIAALDHGRIRAGWRHSSWVRPHGGRACLGWDGAVAAREKVHDLSGPRQRTEVAVNDNAVEAVVNRQEHVAEQLGEKFHGQHPHQAWTGQAHGGRQELPPRR
jgi:hypothetical protein